MRISNMLTTWTIRSAMPDDADIFPQLENSAGTLFRTIDALAAIADGEDLPAARYLELIVHGTSWAADDPSGGCVGFLSAAPEEEALHIWEMGVHPDWQRRGIGGSLTETAIHAARAMHIFAITLTT